jgi:predicted phage terminase large subunit-like protein
MPPLKKPTKKDQALGILRKDLLTFASVISPARFYLASPPVHDEIAGLLLNEKEKQLNIIAPRGIAKTTLATMFIIHHMFFGDEGKKVVVIVSKTQAHAKSVLSTIKDVFNFSPGFRKLFGYMGEQTSRVWREEKIVLGNGNAIIARGTGQPIRGVNEDLQRPTLIIIDDPEDENNTKTVEAMTSNLNWLLQAAVPSVDTLRGRVVVIGTPLHEKCIVMSLSGMSDWKTVHFGNDADLGIALWEESRSLEWLQTKKQALKDVGLIRMYYQEYECKLIPGEDALFKKDYIKYYSEEAKIERVADEPYLKFPNGMIVPVNIYMGIDPASSVTQTADYSTIVPVAVTPNLDIYVLDYFRKRVTPLALSEAIESYYQLYRPNLTTIESTGYQEMLRQYLRTRIFIPGLELKERPRESKSNRLEMLQPFFAQGKIYIKRSMRDLEDELILFPKAKHEDILDGLYYACKRIKPPSHNVEETKTVLPEHIQVYVEYYKKDDEDELPTYYDPFG